MQPKKDVILINDSELKGSLTNLGIITYALFKSVYSEDMDDATEYREYAFCLANSSECPTIRALLKTFGLFDEYQKFVSNY